MARCPGPPARWILLPAADPTELSPGWSHSRPVRDSQPSCLRRSALCSARQAAMSFCQGVSCDAAGAGSSANSRAMKVRQVERPPKRMREYSVEENALKNEVDMSIPASTADHWEAGFAQLMNRSVSSRNTHPWPYPFQSSMRSTMENVYFG